MARFSGKVGFGEPVETHPGVWVDEITERTYFGDVIRANRMFSEGESVNGELRVNNAISIVADPFAHANVFAIRYVIVDGVRWVVSTVENQRPRLVLQLGEVYNGPTPSAAPESP